MKITIESTARLVEIEVGGRLIPARVWEGKTENGVPVACLITRIAPLTHTPEDHAQFETELIETAPVSSVGAQAFPLRMIL